MAIAEQEIPEKTEPKPLPRVRLELVDIFGRMAQSLSFPRSAGEIYGLLYLAPAPMSAPEICEALSISKGSVSTGTRQLLTLGFIRKVWLQEERKDYFEAVLELGEMVRTAYDQIFKMRAQNADRRLTDVSETLADEKGELNPEEYALIKERLARLTKLQKRAKQFMPLLERLIK
jgi:HTH-type transcriptional regulator, glycine betaine synthesis regulator